MRRTEAVSELALRVPKPPHLEEVLLTVSELSQAGRMISSLLRELDAVALATSVMVFLGERLEWNSLSFDLSANTLKCGFHLEKAGENLWAEVTPFLVGYNGVNSPSE